MPRITWREASVLLLSVQSALGCQSTLYASTGDVMAGFTVEHVLPTLMTTNDVALSCSTGLAFAGFLSSFGRVTDPPARASLIGHVSAGFCAEAEAREAELEQLRAIRRGDALAAQDARIVEKRHHYVAASRFLTAHKQLQLAYGGSSSCPELEREDEPVFLLGLAAGVNAVLHDRAAEGRADVPMGIPAEVSGATACLDNERWFGIPHALQAAVWTSVPGLAPDGARPWQQLERAAERGDKAGVRLARALQVQALGMAGRREEQHRALVGLADGIEAQDANPRWRLLDATGTLIALHESDKMWTKATGHRTPAGKLGTFDSVKESMSIDDSLLDDLGKESPELTSEN